MNQYLKIKLNVIIKAADLNNKFKKIFKENEFQFSGLLLIISNNFVHMLEVI